MYEFLKELKNIYDLIIYTASQEEYAKAIIGHIDPDNKYFRAILWREHCVKAKNGTIIKDLRITGVQN